MRQPHSLSLAGTEAQMLLFKKYIPIHSGISYFNIGFDETLWGNGCCGEDKKTPILFRFVVSRSQFNMNL
jgi:hypothetical protein